MLMRRTAAAVVLAALAGLPLGCGSAGNPDAAVPPPGKDASSAADYVNKTFASKVLPNAGRFKPDSAKAAGEGKVRFEDIAGAKYEVTVAQEGGSYKVGEPTPVK